MTCACARLWRWRLIVSASWTLSIRLVLPSQRTTFRAGWSSPAKATPGTNRTLRRQKRYLPKLDSPTASAPPSRCATSCARTFRTHRQLQQICRHSLPRSASTPRLMCRNQRHSLTMCSAEKFQDSSSSHGFLTIQIRSTSCSASSDVMLDRHSVQPTKRLMH